MAATKQQPCLTESATIATLRYKLSCHAIPRCAGTWPSKVAPAHHTTDTAGRSYYCCYGYEALMTVPDHFWAYSRSNDVLSEIITEYHGNQESPHTGHSKFGLLPRLATATCTKLASSYKKPHITNSAPHSWLDTPLHPLIGQASPVTSSRQRRYPRLAFWGPGAQVGTMGCLRHIS